MNIQLVSEGEDPGALTSPHTNSNLIVVQNLSKCKKVVKKKLGKYLYIVTIFLEPSLSFVKVCTKPKYVLTKSNFKPD